MSTKQTKAQLLAELAATKAALAQQTKAADDHAFRVTELNKKLKGGTR